jgi:hypothetical protein
MNDTTTGRFAPGNPGRPKGTKNVRTQQWEELGEAIMGTHAQRFDNLLNRLWDSELETDHLQAAELFLRTLDYFKPKLARVQAVDENRAPPIVIIDDIPQLDHYPGALVRINHPKVKVEEGEG